MNNRIPHLVFLLNQSDKTRLLIAASDLHSNIARFSAWQQDYPGGWIAAGSQSDRIF
jgi:hypothetical protein